MSGARKVDPADGDAGQFVRGNHDATTRTPPRPCGSGGQAAHWAYSLNSTSDVGLAITANALIAAALSLLLLVVTAVVEPPRMATDRQVTAAGSPSR